MSSSSGQTALSVTQINKQAGDLLSQVFGTVEVIGEVSEHKRAASGHHYFALKDDQSQLRCAFFRGNAMRCRYPLREGEEVVVTGRLGIYAARGAYQLIVQSVAPAGEGRLAAEFERLKQRLLAEGLFDAEKKRATPMLPRHIAVISSDTGAAIHDVRVTLARRFPLARVSLFPVRVQGAESAAELRQAVSQLGDGDFDVALVVRGGGSLSDLWSFNDEGLVRAVRDSPVPVISGVGHETDTTLCDLVADRRAATPTGAAELATPVTVADLRRQVVERAGRIASSWLGRLQNEAQRGDWLARRLERAGPTERLRLAHLQLAGLDAPLRRSLERRIGTGRQRLQAIRGELERHHPRRRLQILRAQLDEPRRMLWQLLRRTLDAEDERHTRISRRMLVVRERLLPRWSGLLEPVRVDREIMSRRLENERIRLAGLSRQLEALGPAQVQRRGYALVQTRDEPAALIKRAGDVEARGRAAGRLPLTLRFIDGEVPVVWHAEEAREPKHGQPEDGGDQEGARPSR
ncbi:exodeoxyribonuclease VII large subunit [Guyparkeria hydrothermalis]|uniref:exodeoxyribonuclease VII large subunit n=1 Tax=Guyparkeria hydrothermalis TaxID=923 RepID=UPI0020224AD9|nr:exodeoxyribonuclease VII large subunit [Guyparkeria hydrothermalis]MCL7743743.1 exodeoxyribonuclease VII large subunit [Guyparkeria hydrothermalis]